VLRPDGAELCSRKTPVVKSSLNPTWNKVFADFTKEQASQFATIEFTVLDHDYFSADEFMGQVQLSVNEIRKQIALQRVEKSFREDQWIKFENQVLKTRPDPPKGTKVDPKQLLRDKDVKGTISVAVRYFQQANLPKEVTSPSSTSAPLKTLSTDKYAKGASADSETKDEKDKMPPVSPRNSATSVSSPHLSHARSQRAMYMQIMNANREKTQKKRAEVAHKRSEDDKKVPMEDKAGAGSVPPSDDGTGDNSGDNGDVTDGTGSAASGRRYNDEKCVVM
jgi:hypothetical protein